MHMWELIILTHLLILPHIFQPAFLMVKCIWLITCVNNQAVNSVSHFLIFTVWLLKAAQVRSYEIRYSFDSGCLADSALQHQTHFNLSCIGPRLDRNRLAAGAAGPAPVSWRYTSSAYKNHGHSAHQDLYPSQRWHRHFQSCLDHPIAWPFCVYFPTSPRMKLSQWFHCKAHHTGYMTDHESDQGTLYLSLGAGPFSSIYTTCLQHPPIVIMLYHWTKVHTSKTLSVLDSLATGSCM